MKRVGLSAWLIATAVVLGGCASPANRQAMVVDKETKVAKQHPYSVSVTASGGAETSGAGSSNVSNPDLKAAIEASINDTKVFRQVVEGKGGQYELVVTVIGVSKPTFGFSMTVALETGWTLTRMSDQKVVFRQAFNSSFTAPASAAFVGTERLRLALEGAVKASITSGIKALGDAPL